MPAAPGEMGLDRMYAENNGIAVGDTVTDTNGQTWTVTGYVSLPDYSCLFKDDTDTMFDAIKFGVAIVTQEAFDALPEQQTWNYAWQYDTAPADDRAEKDASHRLYESRQQNGVPAGFCARVCRTRPSSLPVTTWAATAP